VRCGGGMGTTTSVGTTSGTLRDIFNAGRKERSSFKECNISRD